MGGDMLPRAIEMAREMRRGGPNDYTPQQLHKASSGRADVYRHAMIEAGFVIPKDTGRAGIVCPVCGFNFRTDSPRRPISRDGWAVLHDDLTDAERRAVEWCLGSTQEVDR